MKSLSQKIANILNIEPGIGLLNNLKRYNKSFNNALKAVQPGAKTHTLIVAFSTLLIGSTSDVDPAQLIAGFDAAVAELVKIANSVTPFILALQTLAHKSRNMAGAA